MSTDLVSPAATPAVVESPSMSPRTPAAAEPAPGRNERGQFTKSSTDLIPDRPSKTLLSVKQALRTETSVKDDVTAAIERATKRAGIDRALQNVEERPAPSVEKPRRTATKPKPAAAAPAPSAAAPEAPAAAAPAPEPAAEKPAPAEAAKPPRVTVGGKEYTLEEVQAKLAEIERSAAAPAPAAAPEPAPAPPSAEELAAAEKKWISDYAAAIEAPITEDEVDTLLTGGEDAVKLMQDMRRRDIAYAVMQARKNISEGLNPVLQQVFSVLKPLTQHYESLQRYSVTQQFMAKHPDLKGHVDLATQVAETLMQRYPNEFSALNDEQKMDEVARQTTQILDAQWKRFNPQGSWRDAGKAAPAPAPPAPPAAPRPLASNPPSATPATAPGSWQSSVAKSLRR